MGSRRQVLLEAIRTRLTSAEPLVNTPVLLGETPPFGKDDPDTAIVILPGDDAIVKQQGKAIFLELPVELHLLAKVDIDAPWVAIEELLATVKTAIELDDEQLHGNDKLSFQRGSTRTLSREPGSTSIGAVLTYAHRYQETWGTP